MHQTYFDSIINDVTLLTISLHFNVSENKHKQWTWETKKRTTLSETPENKFGLNALMRRLKSFLFLVH